MKCKGKETVKGHLFYLTIIICHFPLLLRCACGLLDGRAALVKTSEVTSDIR